MFGAIKNCGWWSDKVAVKLPDIVLGKVMLEKILFMNILKLLSAIVGCSMWERSTEMKVSQGIH